MASTEELVDRARSGDHEAFAMLFERHHDEIYRYAARRLRDPMTAQDVAAETFADAFSGIGRFRWRGAPFEAWLYTIAKRRIADAYRRSVEPTDEADEGSPDGDPTERVAGSLDLRALIATLPPSERDVIELRFMEDLDVEQTAARLGKRPVAVRVAQHRGLQKLRRRMEETR